jgi:hypothetical protein
MDICAPVVLLSFAFLLVFLTNLAEDSAVLSSSLFVEARACPRSFYQIVTPANSEELFPIGNTLHYRIFIELLVVLRSQK